MARNAQYRLVLLGTLLLLLFLVNGCQPQVVEVEVTRVTTETITVEVEGETVEIEVTRVVEEIVEVIPQTGSQAVGTEEDDPAPAVPTPGPKVEVARDEGWIVESGTLAVRAGNRNPESGVSRVALRDWRALLVLNQGQQHVGFVPLQIKS